MPVFARLKVRIEAASTEMEVGEIRQQVIFFRDSGTAGKEIRIKDEGYLQGGRHRGSVRRGELKRVVTPKRLPQETRNTNGSSRRERRKYERASCTPPKT